MTTRRYLIALVVGLLAIAPVAADYWITKGSAPPTWRAVSDSVETPLATEYQASQPPGEDWVWDAVLDRHRPPTADEQLDAARAEQYAVIDAGRAAAEVAAMPANVTGTTYLYSLSRRQDYTDGYGQLSARDAADPANAPHGINYTVADPATADYLQIPHTAAQLGQLLAVGAGILQGIGDHWHAKRAAIAGATTIEAVQAVTWESTE